MATDDYSPRPIPPQLDNIEGVEQEQQLEAEDTKLSQAYFHPAWEKVEEIFIEAIVANEKGTNNPALPADEYKVADLVSKQVANKLKEILLKVQNAVEQVERRTTSQGGE